MIWRCWITFSLRSVGVGEEARSGHPCCHRCTLSVSALSEWVRKLTNIITLADRYTLSVSALSEWMRKHQRLVLSAARHEPFSLRSVGVDEEAPATSPAGPTSSSFSLRSVGVDEEASRPEQCESPAISFSLRSVGVDEEADGQMRQSRPRLDFQSPLCRSG